MPNQLTPEEKKAKRAATNRANAQKSTGPRTPEGKARARHNSTKHGRRAQIIDYSAKVNTVLLPGEPVAEYVRSVEALVAKLAPRDEVELEIVHRVAAAQWEIRRLRCIRLVLLEDQFQTVGHKIKHQALPECSGAVALGFAYKNCAAPDGGFPPLRHDMAAAERSIAAAYRELRQLRILDPIAGPPIAFDPERSVPQKVYTTAPKPQPEPDEIPPASNPEPVENTEEAPVETPQNHDERTQPKPLVAHAGFGFAIAAPNRRPPFRAEPETETETEPKPKTKTAGGGS
jgi:hypothetical protein